MLPLMNAKWAWMGLTAVLLAGCEKSEQAPPKASVVTEEGGPSPAESSQPLEPVEPAPPEAPVVGVPEEERASVGDRVDRAIEATGHGLQVAGEKTQEGVSTAAKKTEEALHTAGEKTEEGVKKAAEATGGFLKKVGEKLEEAAGGEVEEETTEP